jgi:KRAB domain-containing zinc finger protein
MRDLWQEVHAEESSDAPHENRTRWRKISLLQHLREEFLHQESTECALQSAFQQVGVNKSVVVVDKSNKRFPVVSCLLFKCIFVLRCMHLRPNQFSPNNVHFSRFAVETQRLHQCRKCKQAFVSKELLNRHRHTTHRQKDRFPCQFCPKTYADNFSLKVHVTVHSEEKSYKCQSCDNSFKSYRSFLRHKKTHSPYIIPSLLICPDCGKSYKEISRTAYYAHRKQHTSAKATCDVCHKAVAHSFLDAHKRTQHGNRRPTYPCDSCDKVFIIRKSLATHVESVHQGQHHVCDVCGYSFNSIANLRVHKRTKHDADYEKPKVSCELCDKVFSSWSGRKYHVENVHNGKRFVCETCGKVFTSACGLKNHIKVHTGEKPFACDYCDKKFANSQVRKEHLKVHTKEQPHACKLCDKKYSQRTPLVHHMRTAHGGDKP